MLERESRFDRDWKKIEAFVGSKTVIQIRSHAQKYFLKVQKNGASDHVPPPRPKRKAVHPYPQKASSKNAGAAVSSWGHCSLTPVNMLHLAKEDTGGAIMSCSSGIENPCGSWPACKSYDQGSQIPSLCIMPNFAQVYDFLGSVFDPCTSGHLQKLKEMNPLDVETVLLLMQNLSINLNSPDFEDHRRILSASDAEMLEKSEMCTANNVILVDQAMSTPLSIRGKQLLGT